MSHGHVPYAVTDKPALPGLRDADQLQMRSPVEAEHSDRFFPLVLVNQPPVEEQLTELDARFKENNEPPPIRIPTGVMLETIGVVGTTEKVVSGYIWQKYPLNLSQEIERGFLLTDVVDPLEGIMEEVYRLEEGGEEIKIELAMIDFEIHPALTFRGGILRAGVSPGIAHLDPARHEVGGDHEDGEDRGGARDLARAQDSRGARVF